VRLSSNEGFGIQLEVTGYESTAELEQLADWFDGVAKGAPDPDAGYFMEPSLEFGWTSDPQPFVDVTLAHECAPAWSALSAALREMLAKFPRRGYEDGAV